MSNRGADFENIIDAECTKTNVTRRVWCVKLQFAIASDRAHSTRNICTACRNTIVDSLELRRLLAGNQWIGQRLRDRWTEPFVAQSLEECRAKEKYMTTMKRTLVALAAVVLLVGAMPLLAQEPSTAQGQLMKVDATAKTIAIRTAQGATMQFSYNDDTRVVGADQGVAGLATRAGANLSVQFVKNGQDNVATQIEVQPQKE
jgi:hypothetical protein